MDELNQETIARLNKTAKEAVKHAHAKYSHFKVGAALLAESGDVFPGANVESSSYSLTLCAERVALVKALSEGTTRFKAISIYAEKLDFCPPCGACRQLLYDYAPDIDVYLTNGTEFKKYSLKELLPHAFDESQLKNI